MTEPVHVEFVIRDSCEAILDTGQIIPVTEWYDENGDECEAGDAVSCIAGPCISGYWYTIRITSFESMAVH